MTKRTKTIALFSVVVAFLFCAIMGLLGLNFPTKVSAEYASPIPEGYYLDTSDYAVLDLTQTEITSNSEKVVDALGDAKVARFKFTNKSIKLWSFTICMFTTGNSFQSTDGDNYAGYYFSIPNATTKKIELSLVEKTGGPMTNYANMPFTLPDSLLINSYNTSYNIETAAIPVYNTSGDFAGTYIYLDANGMRVVEYFFQNANYHFTGYNSYLSATAASGSTTSINISEYDQSAINLDGKVTVKLAAEKCYLGETSPAVSQIIATVDGYGQIVEPKYYTISYANTDKAGTATATVTFNGKYSGTASAEFTVVDVYSNYTNPLPNGFYLDNDYTVYENETFSYATAGSESSTMALNGADAVRFSLWYGNAAPYLDGLVQITLFGDTYYKTDSNAGMAVFKIQKSASIGDMSIVIQQTNNKTVKTTQTFPQPEWLDLTTKAQYKFDIGGIDVFDDNGAYAGKFFYVDVNGVRIMEYFYNNSDLKFTNDNWNFWAACSDASGTPFNISETNAIALTGKTKVEIASATSGDTVTIKPIVYAAIKKDGATYCQLIEDKYYTVSYTDNDKVGMATANITFNGKYSGTASTTFEIVNIELTSDTDQTQNILAMKGQTVNLSALTVSGRVFVGYDDNGTLKSTLSVVAIDGATAKFVTIDFETLNKASIKADGTKGMRFATSIETADANKLLSYGTVSFGTRITSPDMAGYLDITTNKWVVKDEVGERDTYYATITNFTPAEGKNYFTTRFMATGYVEIAVGGGDVIRVYAYIDGGDYSKSIAEVAYNTILNGAVSEGDPTYAYISEVASYYNAQ